MGKVYEVTFSAGNSPARKETTFASSAKKAVANVRFRECGRECFRFKLYSVKEAV